MNTPDPVPSLKDLLASLRADAEGFVKKADAALADSRSAVPDALPSGDLFSVVHARLKAAVSQPRPSSDELPAPNTVVAPPTSVPTSSASAASVVTAIPANLFGILSELSQLNAAMTGASGAAQDAPARTWSALDTLVGSVRASWVTVLSGGQPNPNASFWLQEWSSIVQNIAEAAPSWPAPHGTSWADWAKTRATEADALALWIAPGGSQLAALSVPAADRAKGVVPPAPSGVPQPLVSDLQACADFWEWSQSSARPLSWSNTPAKHALDACQSRVENWSPASIELQEWKEKALDRYTVLDARLTLRAASPPAPVPSRSSKPGM